MLVKYWASFTFWQPFSQGAQFFTKIPLRYWFFILPFNENKVDRFDETKYYFSCPKKRLIWEILGLKFLRTQPKVLCYYFQGVIVCRRQIDPHLNKTHSQYIYIHISYFDILRLLTYGFYSYKVFFRNKHRLIAFSYYFYIGILTHRDNMSFKLFLLVL